MSPYCYCADNPLNVVDPDGKKSANLNKKIGRNLEIECKKNMINWRKKSTKSEVRKTILFVCLMPIFSCNVTSKCMTGEFDGEYYHREMCLSLKENNTFTIEWSGSNYSGKWMYTEKGIDLGFDSVGLAELLSSPRFDTENRTIYILNKNTIKYDDHTKLKRIK